MDNQEQAIEPEIKEAAPREWQRPSLRRLNAKSAELNIGFGGDGKGHS